MKRPINDTDNMEWRAWHRIAIAFDEAGLDFNEPAFRPIAKMIREWGEWRTKQHREQGFRYLSPPNFDHIEVARQMDQRSLFRR